MCFSKVICLISGLLHSFDDNVILDSCISSNKMMWKVRATNDHCRCVVCRVGHDMVTYLFDQNVFDDSVCVLG